MIIKNGHVELRIRLDISHQVYYVYNSQDIGYNSGQTRYLTYRMSNRSTVKINARYHKMVVLLKCHLEVQKNQKKTTTVQMSHELVENKVMIAV